MVSRPLWFRCFTFSTFSRRFDFLICLFTILIYRFPCSVRRFSELSLTAFSFLDFCLMFCVCFWFRSALFSVFQRVSLLFVGFPFQGFWFLIYRVSLSIFFYLFRFRSPLSTFLNDFVRFLYPVFCCLFWFSDLSCFFNVFSILTCLDFLMIFRCFLIFCYPLIRSVLLIFFLSWMSFSEWIFWFLISLNSFLVLWFLLMSLSRWLFSGKSDKAITILKFNAQPMPIAIPGYLHLKIHANITKDLPRRMDVRLKLKRKYSHRKWLKLPCLNKQYGSW